MTELGIALVAGGALGAALAWLATRGAAARVEAERDALAKAAAESAQRLARHEEQSAAAAAELRELGSRHAETATALEHERRQLAEARERLAACEGQLEAQRQELREYSGKYAGAVTGLEKERQAAAEKLAIVEEAQARLAAAFKALSADALQSNNTVFLDLARTAFQPLGESMDKVQQRIAELEKAREGAYQGLLQHVEGMARSQVQLRDETARLVNALRMPVQRGRWGEIQLRRVVEMAGMLDHCDFIEQQSVESDAGRLRPDMIVRLPNDKTIVVDAKVSLKAYLEALETTDERAREAKMREHAAQVRAHFVGLGDRAYWSLFSNTPEFVVAFLPGESFYSAALEQDPGLIEFGVDRKVIPATPTTLISLLRAVHYGWRQERIAQNAEAISDLGKELYNRVLKFHEYFVKLRRGLEGAVQAYNDAAGSLESRVLVTARRFKELGAAAGADLESSDAIDRAPRALQAADWPCEGSQAAGA